MIATYSRAQVRAAEVGLLARSAQGEDPDRVMRGAAGAVAERAREMLADIGSRPSPGSRPESEPRAPRGTGPAPTAPLPAVAVFAGGGDNGGDALYAAALLQDSGIACTVLAMSPRLHERAARAARAAGVEILPLARLLAEADASRLDALVEVDAALDAPLWVDGILGTGARGAPRPPLDRWLGELEERRRRTGARVLAIDLPSGGLEDSGETSGPLLHADETVTMGAMKSAIVLPPAAYAAGRVSVHGIGLDMGSAPVGARLVEEADIARILSVPGPLDHKYARGTAGLVAGSDSYPGAGVLAALGAGASGVGMIRLDAPERVHDLVLAQDPGVVLEGGRISAGLVGPGMDEDTLQANRELATFCIDASRPLVIDAGALGLVPELLARPGGGLGGFTVLTPHLGEARRLLADLGETRTAEELLDRPSDAAGRLCELTGAHVLLKGGACVLACPDSALIAIPRGLGWTGVAGAGDVLAGLLVGLAAGWSERSAAPGGAKGPRAQNAGRPGAPSFAEVVAVGALIHARAGEEAALRHGPLGAPIRAQEIAAAIPRVIGAALGERPAPRP